MPLLGWLWRECFLKFVFLRFLTPACFSDGLLEVPASLCIQSCFLAFLCERACMCAAICVCSEPSCVCVCVCVCSGSVTRPIVGHAVGWRHSLWILLSVVLLWRQKAVRATQTTSQPPPHPPFYHQQTGPSPRSPCSPFLGPQSLGCGLWMSATSWLSAQGLAGDWPVVEVQYQALSVSSSSHFLPPLSAGCSQWHQHTPSCDRLRSPARKWKDLPQKRHIHNHANEKWLHNKPLSARVLCF